MTTLTQPDIDMVPSALIDATRFHTEPPGPNGVAAISAFVRMRQSRLEFIRMMADRYGKVSRLSFGGRRLILVSSKSGVLQVLQRESSKYKKGLGFAEGTQFFGKGLVTSETDVWRSQRAALNPFFRNTRLNLWHEKIKAEIQRCIQSIGKRGTPARGLNLEQCIGNFACNILSCTIMGAPLDSRTLRQALMYVDDYVNKKMTGILPEPPISYIHYKNSLRYIQKITDTIIEHNRSRPGSTSLVSHMLSCDQSHSLNVRNQTASFLMAGQDNTTSLISWLLLLLAANPDIQEEFRKNIVGKWMDAEISSGIVEEQRYVCASVFEAMRLFPPVWAITRQAVADTEIDGLHVSKGSQVLLFPFLIHRNPADWSNPEKFDPSRFLGDESVSMLSLLMRLQKERMFVPFGFGPRACIGFQQALVVSIAVATALIQCFDVRFPPHSAFPVAVPGLSLRPHYSARLQFIPV